MPNDEDGSLVISPEAMEAYNQWRARKLAGLPDLSIRAYNEEVLMLSAAWRRGRRAGIDGKSEQDDPFAGGAL